MHIIQLEDFDRLFDALHGGGYEIIGPTLRDGAIVLDTLHSSGDLPRGWSDSQAAASYSLEQSESDALFDYNVGPVSWKKYLVPPRLKLFTAVKSGRGFEVQDDPDRAGAAARKMAFLGVRPCELNAIRIQDYVFSDGPAVDPTYKAARESTMIIAVNCIRAGGSCFCASMGTGPRARGGFDIALTELHGHGPHQFLVDEGSDRGREILQQVPHRSAETSEIEQADGAVAAAVASMGKSMNVLNLKEVLSENFEHPEWEEVAKRCLACANCTMVCPTCFCSTVEDVTDLSGETAERWRRWDSCFTMDFTRVAGGNIRPSLRSRYRQWLTHKLSSWVDQFGVMGCVGCGRCITWCPAGIDITQEAAVIRGTNSQHKA